VDVEVLRRFRVALRELDPREADGLGPPATDEEIEQLSDELAPWRLPHEVEALYRWANGASTTAFAGRCYLTTTELIEEREFRSDMGFGSLAWLPLFRDASGACLIVEAEHTGEREPHVWLLQKDVGPTFSYASLTTFFDTLTAVLTEGYLQVEEFANGARAVNPVDPGALAERVRLLNPPPTGLDPTRAFFPEMGWPESWLAGLGLDKQALTPRGTPSTPFDELVAAAHKAQVSATITGTVVRAQQTAPWTTFTVSDGRADIRVQIAAELVALQFSPQVRVEVDVVLGPGILDAVPVRTDKFPGHPARGIAIRWYPSSWR
jgi:hypothetical protein